MKVKIQQFLFGKNHSWSIVGKSIGRELLKIGHDVDFVSTDGVKDQFVPDCIRPHIRPAPVGTYDLQLSYTAMKNFQPYLTNGSKNRFGIYNYDGSVLPPHWAKCYNHTDKILPSSEYAKQVFIDAKVPESHLIVVPHGIDIGDFDIPEEKIYKLKTKKTVKILNVCGQVHRRKNLAGILEAYGKAFTKDDDVCLVLKVADKPPTTQFEISFRKNGRRKTQLAPKSR
jgi:glycosyltransferase involved in cell wall biosynthesis